MVCTWSLFCFPNCDAKWDLESLCLCFLCEKITEPLLHMPIVFMFLRSLWVVLLLVVILYWGLQGSVTWCFPLYSEIFKSEGISRSWRSQVATVSAEHLPCTQSRVYPQEPPVRHHCVLPAEDGRWDEGCLTLQVPALQGRSSFQLKTNQRKGQGNKGKGLFLRGTVEAAHEQGAFPKYQLCCRNRFEVVWNNIAN